MLDPVIRRYDYDKIRQLLKEGRTYKEIMEEVGCSQSMVSQIKNGRVGRGSRPFILGRKEGVTKND